jgi:hypothetical protein
VSVPCVVEDHYNQYSVAALGLKAPRDATVGQEVSHSHSPCSALFFLQRWADPIRMLAVEARLVPDGDLIRQTSDICVGIQPATVVVSLDRQGELHVLRTIRSSLTTSS